MCAALSTSSQVPTGLAVFVVPPAFPPAVIPGTPRTIPEQYVSLPGVDISMDIANRYTTKQYVQFVYLDPISRRLKIFVPYWMLDTARSDPDFQFDFIDIIINYWTRYTL